jgi:BirA family biotin operon repressor/biotin-[acetyl-CoA-carboxylase] ligase
MPANYNEKQIPIDTKILKTLRSAGAGFVSGADIANTCGISRAAIWLRIESLRQIGFEIEAVPHLGYKLVSTPDLLIADDIASLLNEDVIIGRDIQVYTSTSSTNDIVLKLATSNVAEGSVVFAEYQTNGRGRLGRSWISPAKKGLWFSVLLRPNLSPQLSSRIIIMASTSLVKAINQVTGIQASIKWPNDILINGKKTAGILTEIGTELDKINYIVLGIGINVNLSKGDLPQTLSKTATSLMIESGSKVHRPTLAAAVINQLDSDYKTLSKGNFTIIAEEWERFCETIGKNVTIHVGDRIIKGRAEAVDTDGSLMVRTQHGRLERVIGGDVTLEK